MPKITMALSKPLSNTVSNYSARECLCVESQCLCDDFNLVCLCARTRVYEDGANISTSREHLVVG